MKRRFTDINRPTKRRKILDLEVGLRECFITPLDLIKKNALLSLDLQSQIEGYLSLNGHLLIVGEKGSGKTRLANLLAFATQKHIQEIDSSFFDNHSSFEVNFQRLNTILSYRSGFILFENVSSFSQLYQQFICCYLVGELKLKNHHVICTSYDYIWKNTMYTIKIPERTINEDCNIIVYTLKRTLNITLSKDAARLLLVRFNFSFSKAIEQISKIQFNSNVITRDDIDKLFPINTPSYIR